jgi:hypothetical protein
VFGSKNKSQKSQVEVDIETMEGNLKGQGGKTTTIEYAKPTDEAVKPTSTTNISTPTSSQNGDNSKAPFKSPFNGADLPTGNTEGGLMGQGTFSNTPNENILADSKTQETENLSLSNDIESGKNNSTNSQKNDSPFLHQTVDGKIENGLSLDDNKPSETMTEKIPKKSGKSMSSLFLIILFIFLLAGILFGGYYFYMNKDKSSEEVVPVENSEQVSDENVDAEQAHNEIKQEIEEKAPAESNKPVVEELITSPATFNEDLKMFITGLKERRTALDLQNGIFITPVDKNQTPMIATVFLEALHMTDFFKEGDLKDSCKIFTKEDNGQIRLAVVFELSDIADRKLVKDLIIEKENVLMKKMSYLFVDGVKPEIPTEIKFKISNDNPPARYANYSPGVDTSSVDWNVLDLGNDGALVYFATSRNTAKELREHFIRLVRK